MKKLSLCLFLVLLFCGNTVADPKNRDVKLNQLFEKLKKSNNISIALEIEKKIWKIWSIHPSNDRRGYRLTELLAQGSFLMAKEELNKAYEIFSQIILVQILIGLKHGINVQRFFIC